MKNKNLICIVWGFVFLQIVLLVLWMTGVVTEFVWSASPLLVVLAAIALIYLSAIFYIAVVMLLSLPYRIYTMLRKGFLLYRKNTNSREK